MKLHNLAEASTLPGGELLDMWSLQTGSCTLEELQLGVGWGHGSDQKDVAVQRHWCCFAGLLPAVLYGTKHSTHAMGRCQGVQAGCQAASLGQQKTHALCRLGSSTLFLWADGITPEGRAFFIKACVCASSSHDAKEKLTSLTQDQAVMTCQLVALSPTAPSSSSHHPPREEVVRTAPPASCAPSTAEMLSCSALAQLLPRGTGLLMGDPPGPTGGTLGHGLVCLLGHSAGLLLSPEKNMQLLGWSGCLTALVNWAVRCPQSSSKTINTHTQNTVSMPRHMWVGRGIFCRNGN